MRMATVRDRLRIAAALAVVILAWIPNGAARADSSVVDLPLGGGAVERVLYMAPANPSAVLVMFPGGDGIVRLGPDGTIGVGAILWCGRASNGWTGASPWRSPTCRAACPI